MHELGIFAMSPELGINRKSSDKFFIKDKSTLTTLLIDNLVWIQYAMRLLVENIHCDVLRSEVTLQVVKTTIECRNNGVEAANGMKLRLTQSGNEDKIMIEVQGNEESGPIKCQGQD